MAGPNFVVSSFCLDTHCVAVAALDNGARAVRDAKDAAGTVLTFTSVEWADFVARVRSGELDPDALTP